MTDQSTDTKVKIMQVARILFATNGFEGTSIREIAKAAEVNVASVNYHFSNKENLFAEILRAGYTECSEAIRKFAAENSPSVEETLVHLFHYYMGKSHDLISYFKMMMSSQHSHNMAVQDDEFVGPPGGATIIEALMKEVGGKLEEKDLHWALKCLFSNVTHTCIMYNCCFKDNKVPYSSVNDLEENIRRLAKLVVADLKLLKKHG